MDSDMKKIIIALLLLIAAACGIIAVRRVACRVPAKPMQSDPPVLKEWVNDSMADLPPGYVPRYQWAGNEEREKLESVWAMAATNLQHGDVRTKAQAIGRTLLELETYPEQVVMVGDRFHDVEGAASFGIPCIGVLWGNTGTREELMAAGAVAVVDTVDELASILSRADAS